MKKLSCENFYLKKEVEQLRESLENLSQDHRQLSTKLVAVQTGFQQLEMEARVRARVEQDVSVATKGVSKRWLVWGSSKDPVAEAVVIAEESCMQKEAAAAIVEKLVCENAELMEKVNQLHKTVDQLNQKCYNVRESRPHENTEENATTPSQLELKEKGENEKLINGVVETNDPLISIATYGGIETDQPLISVTKNGGTETGQPAIISTNNDNAYIESETEVSTQRKDLVMTTDVENCISMPDSAAVIGEAHVSSKGTSMENIEDCRNRCLEHEQDDLASFKELGSSGRKIQCTSCSSSERNDCIIVCNKCQNAYHIYCVSPPLEAIPMTSWYCSFCSAIRKDSSEIHSMCDGEGTVLKEDTNNAVFGCSTADLHSGLMEMNNAQENCEVDTSVDQVESESIMKKLEAKASDELIGIQEDSEQIPLHINQTERVVHSNGQESELHDDKRLNLKLCKICSTGTRDDDHLIQCSNEDCLYKFYHLRCLRPPLASVPPRTWYCPSCLCRSCFMDENDADIVLCDGCDDAYHTYCLNPPLDVIPESNWYCPSCLERQKRRKRKSTLNSTASGSKSTGRVRSKKTSQVQYQTSLLMDRTDDLTERTAGLVGYARTKSSSQIVSPSHSYMHIGSHDPSDKIVKGETDSSMWHEESRKESQSANCLLEEAGQAPSDNSLDNGTENFIVRVRPRNTTKYKTSPESKDAGKRKRKCSEPRRSQV